MGLNEFNSWLNRTFKQASYIHTSEPLSEEGENLFVQSGQMCVKEGDSTSLLSDSTKVAYQTLYIDIKDVFHFRLIPASTPAPMTGVVMIDLMYSYINRLFFDVQPQQYVYIDNVNPGSLLSQLLSSYADSRFSGPAWDNITLILADGSATGEEEIVVRRDYDEQGIHLNTAIDTTYNSVDRREQFQVEPPQHSLQNPHQVPVISSDNTVQSAYNSVDRCEQFLLEQSHCSIEIPHNLLIPETPLSAESSPHCSGNYIQPLVRRRVFPWIVKSRKIKRSLLKPTTSAVENIQPVQSSRLTANAEPFLPKSKSDQNANSVPAQCDPTRWRTVETQSTGPIAVACHARMMNFLHEIERSLGLGDPDWSGSSYNY